MNNWLRDGIEGRNLRDVLKLYLFGALFAAPLALLLWLLFDVSAAFTFTPAFLALSFGITYISAYLNTYRYVGTGDLTAPVPWLQLLPLETSSKASRVIQLTNRATYVANWFGRWSKALELYERALLVDDSIAETWSNKAIALWQLGRFAGALGCINKALNINPNIAEIWFNRALASWKLGSIKTATRSLALALEINPEFSKVWFREGVDYDTSLVHYEESLSNESDPAEKWLFKGHLFFGIHRYAEAMECFEIASKLGHPEAAKELAASSQLLENTP